MALDSDEKDPQPIKADQQAMILADWLVALDAFQNYHTRLSPYVNLEDRLPGVNLEMGQCPPMLVKTLVLRMQEALESLLDDFGSVDIPAAALGKRKAKKLVTHTQILNGLNQQAQVVVQLIKQTPM